MNKLFAFLCVSSLILCLASPAAAGGIDSKTNWSVEYFRTLNRNAATDYADIAVYNPAGTVKRDDGLYFNISFQYLFKDFSNTYLGTEYESNEPTLIPGVFAIYKQDRWSLFGAITNTGGGGAVDFDKGSKSAVQQATLIGGLSGLTAGGYTIDRTNLFGESFYISYTVGGAYQINDMISFSLGARLINASKETDANFFYTHPLGPPLAPDVALNVDYKETAEGWGGIVGLNISPTDDLNIGLRYESVTALNFKTKVLRDDTGTLVAGSKARRDLPALLGLGVSYRFSKKLRAETNLTYYFEKNADWEGAEDNVDNSFDLGLSLEYMLNPRWTLSCGYVFAKGGMPVDEMLPENPELDAHSVAAGFAFAATPKLDLNFGVGNAFYVSETQSDGTELEKNIFYMALGLEYKFN